MRKHTLKVSKEESMGKLYEWSNYDDDYYYIGKMSKEKFINMIMTARIIKL